MFSEGEFRAEWSIEKCVNWQTKQGETGVPLYLVADTSAYLKEGRCTCATGELPETKEMSIQPDLNNDLFYEQL